MALLIKIKQVVIFGRKFIDYKMGIAGAFVMGGVVFSINYFSTCDFLGSLTASLKQATYTFLFGGILMRTCEYIATHGKRRVLAIVASAALPSIVTLILTYSMHNLKGTPKPLESTIPTLIIIPATAIWGYIKRKQLGVKSI